MAFSPPANLRTLYLEVLEHPKRIKKLSGYQKSKLREYAEQESMRATRTAVAMMNGSLDYPYPDEYRNGREEEYLLSKHSPAYWDSQRMLQLLAKRPVAPQPAETIPTVSLAEVKPKATPPTAIPIDFSLYIKEEYREKLIPFLKAEYTGQRPQAVACMLIALQDLGCLKRQLKENETTLHASLTTFLGSVGARAGLNGNLTKLDGASEKQNLKIQAHRNHIKTYMEQA